MPFNSKARSQKASTQLRDKNGHFYSPKSSAYSPKPKVKVSGQANLLADLVKTEDGDDKGSSWINLTINHPFRKIIEILDEIRKKQSTRVSLDFTIPLVALPIVIIMAFQFGRYQSACQTHFSSQIGTLENITVTQTIDPDHWIARNINKLPFISGIYSKEETFEQPTLVKGSAEQGILIENISNTDLDPFTRSKVIIYGDYNSCTNTLTLDSPQNISNY